MPYAKLIKNYWHIIMVRNRKGIVEYKLHDVGRPHSNQRLTGMTKRGVWKLLSWRVHKENVRVERGTLVALNERTKNILNVIKRYHGKIRVRKR